MIEVYLGLSLLIGLIIIYEARYILSAPNNPVTPVTAITSIIELVWAIVSIFALLYLPFSKWQILLPTFYITHNVIGWIYGFWLAGKLTKQNSNQLVIPSWYAKFSFNFGIIYTVLGMLAIIAF
ncbi:hypothetical protein HG263_00705 [Pseudoalteromonas sp. JBTF-M23]|uniref:Uncharacterized protein n=1 Tax=Pseudoalteromonas caenipelagi TaxID=2726988 RepID=A0A849V8H1_9GAMM|nr:hypothetical protein [Pseudoalteromonas caenipelagi]NOU49070.1 hypothetical protein [Pseudoalteromonas caenipelagi]